MTTTTNTYTISEAAAKLSISSKTLRRWEETGRFTGSRTVGGQRRYSTEDLQILDAIAHNIIPTDQELLTIEQAAETAGVTVATISRWTASGELNTFITSDNSYYLKTQLVEKLKQNIREPATLPQITAKAAVTLTPLATNPGGKTKTNEIRILLLNIITTLAILGAYHMITTTTLKNQSATPGLLQPTTSQEDPKLGTIKNLFDTSGNLNTAGTIRVGGQLITPRFTLSPTTRPNNPSAGNLYFDASTRTLELYDGQIWISLGSAPEATSSATTLTPTGSPLLVR